MLKPEMRPGSIAPARHFAFDLGRLASNLMADEAFRESQKSRFQIDPYLAYRRFGSANDRCPRDIHWYADDRHHGCARHSLAVVQPVYALLFSRSNCECPP